MNVLQLHIEELHKLCSKYKVRKLYAFGSVLTHKFNEDSDIDLLVEFQSIPLNSYFDNYFDFKFELEDLFNREVDLLEQQAIKNPVFLPVLENTMRLIYDDRNQNLAA